MSNVATVQPAVVSELEIQLAAAHRQLGELHKTASRAMTARIEAIRREEAAKREGAATVERVRAACREITDSNPPDPAPFSGQQVADAAWKAGYRAALLHCARVVEAAVGTQSSVGTKEVSDVG